MFDKKIQYILIGQKRYNRCLLIIVLPMEKTQKSNCTCRITKFLKLNDNITFHILSYFMLITLNCYSICYFPRNTVSVVSVRSLKASQVLLQNGGWLLDRLLVTLFVSTSLNLLPSIAGGAPLISLGSWKQAGFTLGRLKS